MNPDKKANLARILGYFCIAVGVLDLVLAGILMLRGRTEVRYPLLGTGFVALTGGIIMVALGKRR